MSTDTATVSKQSLNSLERTTLRNCEKTIKDGLETFREVGEALEKIRDEQLFRETHATFKAYCKEKWGFSDSRARQLIGGAKCASEVAKALPGVTLSSEKHARILGKLPKQEQKQAMAEAVELAGGGTPTKEQLEAVVEMRLEKAEDAESEWEPSDPDRPEEKEEPVVETGLTAFQAQGCFKQWQETIRHMMSDRVGIDAFREAFPGPLGDRTIDAAKALFEALGAWRKGIK